MVSSFQTVTPDGFRRLREVFEAALERPVEERQAYVERACGGDLALRAEVERMLAAEHGGAPVLLDEGVGGRPWPVHVPTAAQTCSSCQSTLTLAQRFCGSCGSPVGLAVEGRFRAGALFAGRFRIVSALGRGGMGEVYRADDLELGQTVALKFLTAFRTDERARARLRGEVRHARQISHPNVCRVYDIGDANGELYLSMEYVDGEDLAALLKRIGRLPIDKGVEIARKLCAGLAAAHAKGVLHRDFKPANIMIDGQGEVRIMDFGLAAAADNIDVGDVRSGTPAYMAPEQLAGREATRQSDLYALGLVLYELLTGKPPFAAKDLQELLRLREGAPATTPSTLIPEITPRLERAVLACLEPDPKLRPASALEVSASLPGGDPLAEALAAGETPSPDLVAAAGPTEGLAPRRALLLTLTIVAFAAAIVFVTPRVHMLLMMPLRNAPETLTVRARDAVRALGYVTDPVSTAAGFDSDAGYVDYYQDRFGSLRGRAVYDKWRALLGSSPLPLSFWYRQGPAVMIPERDVNVPRVTLNDPPMVEPGMVLAVVDLDGRLQRFRAIPAGSPADRVSTPDWTVPFQLAGLDIARFTASGGRVVAEDAVRASWTGFRADRPDLPIRVQATAHGGRVSAFEVWYPWSRPAATANPRPLPPVLGTALGLMLIAAIVLSARYNVLRGRSDVRGAYRLTIGFGAVILAIWGLGTTHATAASSFAALLYRALPFAVFNGLLFGLIYLGIEPWIRRYWPETMITWSRALAGRWADPVVGRDVLVGIAWGVGSTFAVRLVPAGVMWLGGTPAPPSVIYSPLQTSVDKLLGGPLAGADLLTHLVQGYATATGYFLGLFVFRAVLRRGWLAVVACFAFFVTMNGALLSSGPDTAQMFWTGNFGVVVGMLAILTVFSLVVALRHGVFASVVFTVVGMMTNGFLLTPNLGAWYGQTTLIGLIIVAVLTLWALRTSVAGRPLLDFEPARPQR